MRELKLEKNPMTAIHLKGFGQCSNLTLQERTHTLDVLIMECSSVFNLTFKHTKELKY